MTAPLDTSTDRQAAALAKTQLGNAQRLALRHRGEVHYCPEEPAWYVWDGRRFQQDKDNVLVERRAHAVVAAIADEARTFDDFEYQRMHMRHHEKSQSHGQITGMVKRARVLPEVTVAGHEFDRDPWLLNVLNGTVDIRTGELQEHRREDLLTKLTPVVFDPDAVCPRWLTFLDETLDSPELVDYLQQVVGYSLTGDVSDQSIFVFAGDGNNGKSTLLNTMLFLAGDEYGLQAPSDLLVARRRDSHPTAFADMQGRRLVVASELNERAQLDEALVKSLSGGETLSARRMRADYQRISPTWKLFLSVNHLPVITGRDEGIWRRLRYIPFTRQISGDQRDPHLGARLQEEMSGILNWALEGAGRWLSHGELTPPDEVTYAVRRARYQQDPILGFLEVACDQGPTYECRARDLYAAYEQWHKAHGTQPQLTKKAFGLELARHGFSSVKRSDAYWAGLRLRR